jgi:3-isopropylmalate/(R)-2-methylmalate dehydratase small subunit
MRGKIIVQIDLERNQLIASSDIVDQEACICEFCLNSFDKELVAAGGWLAYADQKY